MSRAVGAAALLLATLHAAALGAQVSPGPLARPHAALEGVSNCTQCHGGQAREMPAKCLACHREIGWLVEQGRGLHAANPSVPCASCHPDHAGREFQLVQWPDGGRDRFDHRRAGWALAQSHATLRCGECHEAGLTVGPAARLAPRPAAARWTTLERDCVSCHQDPHEGDLSRRCDLCHDAAKWEEPVRFDHAATDYPLTGRHADVACNDCHVPAGRPIRRRPDGRPNPVYAPLAHATCAACHRDPHRGRLGADCAGCHQTTDFAAIRKAGFDHERTRYPLRGRHASVRCEGCHDPASARQYTPEFATCGDCHGDAHAGAATLAGRPADCSACHGLNGFSPATLPAARHADTRYPLEGKHRTVACSACHVAVAGGAGAALGTSRVALRPTFESCTACHRDDHAGQLARRAGAGRCEECHTPSGWRPSSFGAGEHADLAVRLEGAHGRAPCAACHGAERPGLRRPDPAGLGRARVALSLPDTACADCHRDPHEGRFAADGARPVTGGCAACHDATAFRPAGFDAAAHAGFGFPLAGAHGAVPCGACHDDLGAAAPAPGLVRGASLIRATSPLRRLPLTVARTACADCHDSPHGDQFGGAAGGTGCDACHDAAAFAPAARFDHDRASRFALAGAHQRVPCAQCHRPGSGDGVVRYRPLDPRCESCHGGTR